MGPGEGEARSEQPETPREKRVTGYKIKQQQKKKKNAKREKIRVHIRCTGNIHKNETKTIKKKYPNELCEKIISTVHCGLRKGRIGLHTGVYCGGEHQIG